MKARHIIYAATAATLALASCSKDEGGIQSPPESNFPNDGLIRVTTDVSEAARTRASITTPDLDYFFLSVVTTDDGGTYNYFRQMTKNASGEWTPKEGIMPWKDRTTPVTVAAAVFGGKPEASEDNYVFSAANLRTASEKTTLTLPTTQSTQEELNSADLLAMKPAEFDPTKVQPTTGGLTADGKIPLHLDHALSKLNIKITSFKAISAATEITNFKINNVATKFDYAVAAVWGSDISNLSTPGSITPLAGSLEESTAHLATGEITYESILVPGTYVDFSVSFTFGGKTYSWTGPVTLAQGNEYVLPLDLGDNLIHTNAEDPNNLQLVGDWNTGTNNSNTFEGGTMTEGGAVATVHYDIEMGDGSVSVEVLEGQTWAEFAAAHPGVWTAYDNEVYYYDEVGGQYYQVYDLFSMAAKKTDVISDKSSYYMQEVDI